MNQCFQKLCFIIFYYIYVIIYEALKKRTYNVRNVATQAVVGVTNCKLDYQLFCGLRKREGLPESMSYATFKRRVETGVVFRDLNYAYEMIEVYGQEAVENGELLALLVK